MSGNSGTGIVLASFGRSALVQSGDETLSCALKGRKQRILCGDRIRWTSDAAADAATIDSLEPRRNLLERIDARRPRRAGRLEHRSNGGGGRLRAQARLVSGRSLLGRGAAQGHRGAADRQQSRLEIGGSRRRASQLPSARPAIARGVGTHRRRRRGVARGARRHGYAAARAIGRRQVIARRTSSSRTPRRRPPSSRARWKAGTPPPPRAAIDCRPPQNPPSSTRRGCAILRRRQASHVRRSEASSRSTNTRADCHFSDCRHLEEPRCAVRSAVQALEIAPRRYESYRRLYRLYEKLAP